LFNSLNSIYALALSKSDLASEAVLKLSGMMRYVLAKANQELVMLEEEINYLSDFIALQRIRLGNTAKVEYRLEVTPDKGTMIAPLLLIPFVENAFKHGVDPEKEAEILVVLRVEGRSLTLETHNRKCSPIHFLEDEGGIGLSNTRERLKVLYPGRHHLKIVDDGVRFSIVLEIQL
jgi:LytS/YehU family sensor histidine kinase